MQGVTAEGLSTGLEGASYESAGWAEGAGEHQDAIGSADEVNMWAGGSSVRRG